MYATLQENILTCFFTNTDPQFIHEEEYTQVIIFF